MDTSEVSQINALSEFVQRLSIRPKEVKVAATVDEMRGLRNSLELTYEFKGTLLKLGEFLNSIALDVQKAGCYVVNFAFPIGLSPADDSFVASPSGDWSTVAIRATIKTAQELDDRRASWAGIVDYFRTRRTK